MKYACFGYFDQEKMDALSKGELDKVMKECEPYLKGLYGSAEFLMDIGVKTESVTLGHHDGRIERVDGNTKTERGKKIGGVFIIEAKNMEEAIEAAKRHPALGNVSGADLGWSVEIREIYTYVIK
ncbi:MAG TPA: YciI family protein [Candidatus Kryptonia bacterium]